jgi:CBS domain-containing protein
MDRDWAYLATPSTTLGQMLSTIQTGERPYFVVQKNREPVGIISVTDIAAFADEPLMADMVIAADIMTSNLWVIEEEDSLYEALTVFRERKVEVLPVVGSHGGRAMEGLLTRRKVFRLVASQMERLRETTLKEHAGLGIIEEDTQMTHLLSGLPAPELGDVQRMLVPRELVGQTLASANYRAEYDGEVLAIQTAEGSFLCPADPRRELTAGDQLIVISSPRKS